MQVEDLDQNQCGVALALGVARAALEHHGDMLAALRHLYPWTDLFSVEAQEQLAREMDSLVWASAELGHFGQLVRSFTSWQGSTEALADGMRPEETLTWLDDAPDVPRPT